MPRILISSFGFRLIKAKTQVSSLWLLCIVLFVALPALAQKSTAPSLVEQPAPNAASSSPVTTVQVECLPPSRASELLDKHGCVAGKVFRVSSQKNGNLRIFFGPNHDECEFQAVVFARDRDSLGDLSYLHGRLVAVIGEVIEYRDHAEIVVKDRKQIQVAATDPPKQFDADQSRPGFGSAHRGGKRGRAW
ncbi:MAG: hypothetical protein CXZ00_03745 [Acidobacteria bacterium]|nr:MAG: hypothetical protein CXZ00_03745 [Acidobacteriota bacterium]